MNATMMPNEFRGKIDGCNVLINEANKVMGKPDEFGIICPVAFIEDYISCRISFLRQLVK